MRNPVLTCINHYCDTFICALCICERHIPNTYVRTYKPLKSYKSCTKSNVIILYVANSSIFEPNRTESGVFGSVRKSNS